MATRWLERAADNGHVEARFQLATMTLAGIGVAKNEEAALAHFLIAAEQQHVRAQIRAGTMYSGGIGTVPNARLSFKWFLRAAEQGNPQAQFLAGWAYEFAAGVPANVEQLLHWYRKAAAAGVPDASMRLGVVFSGARGLTRADDFAAALDDTRLDSWKGKDTTKDLREAHYWLASAVRDDHLPATEALAILETRIGARLPDIRRSTKARIAKQAREEARSEPAEQESS